jgi:two-component system NtrC family sensor kinase
MAETHGLCFVPIRTSRGVLGVIGADRQVSGRPISDEDVQNLLTFANAMGLALEKALLLQEMRGSEELSRSILESSDDAMVALDPAWRVTTWNRAAERLFHFSREEMIGATLHQLFGHPDRYREWLERLMKDGRNSASGAPGAASPASSLDRQMVASWLTKEEKAVEVSMTWAPLKGDAGRVLGWAGVIRDLTRERQLHQTMMKTEKLAAMGQLVAGIAHELNNPLSAVTGFAEILHESPHDLPPDVREDVERIYLSAVRCKDLIRGLLLFARPTEGARRLVDLHRSVELVLSLFRLELQKHGVAVTLRQARSAVWAHADPIQLEQIFVNLCQNACHAMAVEGVTDRQLTFHFFTVGDLGGVTVRDSGPGVPEALREKIFEPFFSTKPQGEGTGLGLYLAREIALSHGGHLSYENFDGEGPAFVLTLPSAAPAPTGVTAAPRRAASTAPAGRVLVVDDDREVADLLERVIVGLGHQVWKAATVHQAEEILKREEMDLIVSDLELGGLGGYQFLEGRVRASGPRRILVVTGNVMSPSARQFVEGLGVEWWPKPLDLPQFREVVNARLRVSREESRAPA